MVDVPDAPWIQDYDKYFKLAYQCTDDLYEDEEIRLSDDSTETEVE